MALAGPDSASLLEGASFRIDARARCANAWRRSSPRSAPAPLAIDPSKASLYHAAAVLAGNAPLALLAEATRLLESAGVSAADAHAALAALLQGAAHNAAAPVLPRR